MLIEEIVTRRAKPALMVPVVEALELDLDPLEAFVRLSAPGSRSFLFESAEIGGKSARYSFVGSGATAIVVKDGRITVGGAEVKSEKGPVAFLKDFMAGYRQQAPVYVRKESFSGENPPLPPFSGGLAGYISYDFVRYVDPIGSTAVDDLNCPDVELLFVQDLVVFDHVRRKKLLIANADGMDDTAIMQARERLRSMEDRLAHPASTVSRPPAVKKPFVVKCPTSKEQYMKMVERSKEYILDGDAFQIVLSQRQEVETDVDHVALYRHLKQINPSPYMYFLEFGDISVVGSSPEILVRLQDKKVIVRPIAGTRPRGKSDEEDKVLEAEMKADPKEVAEHVMLVDLGRNDVGKVSKFGSVKVDDFMGVEKYSHVQHIVSNVVGDLADGKDAVDTLAATFPAGTVSGAPKTRAMQIIEELEGRRRGLYAGCVGYISFNGNTDMAITIRTIVLKGGKAYVQAGAGIVLDSVPENEYYEAMSKGAAMLRALETAAGGK
ncbi:anthranilate synthase component I [Methanocella arvoryzae]|uniref:anthranilate synthase n=1 Tax=Methanocella arvoryzae (strain DSM 22066 / NBRC 105507 / MRE50) TaxID=351160 RepID=Q0W626_METAR|nr:anthranilate synthase component I [Methanocella arvoryzae]CAJ36167.1 anthranilate synthase, component I [Methanocella arvoryzae MRE50]